jgi:hypothetical protein
MACWGLLSALWIGRKITKQLPNTKSEALHRRFGQLSQIPLYKLFKEGAGSRARTDDLLITNQLLYQLSYTGAVLGNGRKQNHGPPRFARVMQAVSGHFLSNLGFQKKHPQSHQPSSHALPSPCERLVRTVRALTSLPAPKEASADRS